MAVAAAPWSAMEIESCCRSSVSTGLGQVLTLRHFFYHQPHCAGSFHTQWLRSRPIRLWDVTYGMAWDLRDCLNKLRLLSHANYANLIRLRGQILWWREWDVFHLCLWLYFLFVYLCFLFSLLICRMDLLLDDVCWFLWLLLFYYFLIWCCLLICWDIKQICCCLEKYSWAIARVLSLQPIKRISCVCCT